MKILRNKTYKLLIDEIDSLDKSITTYKVQLAKLHEEHKENEYLRETNDKYISTIKDLRKKIRFLNKREKKLQTIEMLYANQPVDLKELNNLIMGVD